MPVMMPPPASNARLERLCTHLVPGKSTADVSTESAAGVVRWLRSLFDGGGGGATDGEQGGTGRVALGTVQLGMAYGAGNTTGLPSVAEATEIVHLAVESGISVLDTAYGYGLSEERIGQALKELPPELPRPWVVTKVNAACGDAETGAAAREIVQQSLVTSRERLQVESLDTVLLHHFKMYQNNDGAAWQALVEARERGETQKIGVSTYEPEEVMEALADPDMQHIQLPFNLLAAEWKTDEFASAVAARPDVTIHVRSIYLQGLLVADRTRWPTFCAHATVLLLIVLSERMWCPSSLLSQLRALSCVWPLVLPIARHMACQPLGVIVIPIKLSTERTQRWRAV